MKEINYIDVCRAKIFPSTKITNDCKHWWDNKTEFSYKFHEGDVLINKAGTPAYKIKILGCYVASDNIAPNEGYNTIPFKTPCYLVEIMRNEYKKDVPLSHYYSYTQKNYFLITEKVDNLFKLDPSWIVKQICD